jgi:hypothetical protein
LHLQIPPLVPYLLGLTLVFFGILRVKYLGAPRVPRATDDEATSSTEAAPVRGKDQRRHIRMGVIWVLLGLFLVASTYYQTRRH